MGYPPAFIRDVIEGRNTMPHIWRRNVLDLGLRQGCRIVRPDSERHGPGVHRLISRRGR